MATNVLTKSGLVAVWNRIKGIYDPKISSLKTRVDEIESDIDGAVNKLNEIVG